MAKFTSVDDYVASLSGAAATNFATVRRIIEASAPGAVSLIRYDMPAWRIGDITLIHAAAWKQHIGLYPVYRGDEAFEAVVGPLRDKKDTVRLPHKQAIPEAIIARIVLAQLKKTGLDHELSRLTAH